MGYEDNTAEHLRILNDLTQRDWTRNDRDYHSFVLYATTDDCLSIIDVLKEKQIPFGSSIWIVPMRGRPIDKIVVSSDNIEKYTCRGRLLGWDLGIL